MSLTITTQGHWRAAKGRDARYLYAVEYAKSGRGKCRKCSEYVPKGEVRFGVPIRDPRGEHGYISAWQHIGCTRVEERDDALVPFIHGMTDLKAAERAHVVAEVTSTTVPPQLRALDPDDLIRRGVLERVAPPPSMLQTLLPFQEEGLGWMSSQEQTEYRGGILADEMGMGKTIQTISLMLRNRGTSPTLVICPVSSMNQWREEIERNVTPDALVVRQVTKTTRMNRAELEAADVVLTTYPVIELAYRKLLAVQKVPCAYCSKLYLPRQLKNHNKYFCGPNARMTIKQSKRERTVTSAHEAEGDETEAATVPFGPASTRRLQTRETIRKGLRTLRVEIDEDEDDAAGGDDNDDDNAKGSASAAPPAGRKSVAGPMDIYRELMSEAGRGARSRWEPGRKQQRSSSSSSDDDNEDDSGGYESDDDAKTGKKEEKLQSNIDGDDDEAKTEHLAAELRCEQCGFQKLRYPFCPRTGQHHVVPSAEELFRRMAGEVDDLNDSVLHSIQWFRIVLDEAHRIKMRTSNTARSVYALRSERKWCLTGTPLQNRVGELYSLLRFLQVAPYSQYFCGSKGCSCSSLAHPFSGTSLRACVFCGHGPIQHYSYFNKHIMNPINRHGYIGDGKQALILLSNGVLNAIMLRRTKAERVNELRLPAMSVRQVAVALTPEERDLYDSLYKRSASKFDTFVKKGTMLHNYAHIFQLLSRLRQALDHPVLVTRHLNDEDVVGRAADATHVCAICQDDVVKGRGMVIEPCKHAFHPSCLTQYLDGAPAGDLRCPACFVPASFDLRRLRELEEELEEGADGDAGAEALDDDDGGLIAPVAPSFPSADGSAAAVAGQEAGPAKAPRKPKAPKGIMANIDAAKFVPNSKMRAVLEYLQSIPTDEKAIVFSQFGAMLDLLEFYLARNGGLHCVKLTGSLPMPVRQSILNAFRTNPAVRVILISLKAGGEGLNLQNANHVLLTDPWWNPAVEMQAVQRAHRIGQTRPVHALRFVTTASVEERMMDLQGKKMLVFEGTIDGKCSALHSLSEEDMQFLFSR